MRLGLGTIISGVPVSTLQVSEFTLAEVFKKASYATAMKGKWHLGVEKQNWPTNQGFDEYRVGVIETSNGTQYRRHLELAGLPASEIESIVPKIVEGTLMVSSKSCMNTPRVNQLSILTHFKRPKVTHQK